MSLNLESLFGDASLNYDCPKCQTNIPFKLSDVGSIITCPGCKFKIQLNQADNFDETVDSVNDSLSELEDTFSDLQKSFSNFGK